MTPAQRPALAAMLEARSIALVGASQRPGSLGAQMVKEAAASASRPRLYPVNPRYREVGGLRCLPGLAELPEPADLVLLAVPDIALEEQLTAAAVLRCRSAAIFGGAHDGPGRPPGLRARLAGIAETAGMALCGAGCMGFVNVAHGLRAIGYAEPDPVPPGPVALVTHSGSVFSTLLYSRRGFGFTIAVSSGQELVTTAADYAGYALALPQTRVLALVMEAIRDAPRLRSVLAGAAAADVPVVLLAAGGSDSGRDLVTAHSGALAAGDGAWDALAAAYGVHRVGDLAELADTLELFAAARRAAPPAPRPTPAAAAPPTAPAGPRPTPAAAAPPTAPPGPRPGPVSGRQSAPGPAPPRAPRPGPADGPGAGPADGSGPGPADGFGVGLADVAGSESDAGYGLATVHDSGLERAHVADLAQQLGVPFAAIGEATRVRLAAVLDPGLEPGNPLDIWGTGRDPERQLTEALAALADDPAVGVVAFAVDLVPEEDESYPRAMLAVAARTGKPLAVLAGLPSTVDRATAVRLRTAGIPVLEGTRSGLLALRHLLARAARPPSAASAAAAPEGNVVVVATPTKERGGYDNDHKPVPPAPAEPALPAPGANDMVVAAPSLEQQRCHNDDVPGWAADGGSRLVGSGQPDRAPDAEPGRAERWRAALAAGPLDGAASFGLLREYGIPVVRVRAAASLDAALAAADGVGYPVVLKTDQPGIAHKADVGGVRLGLAGPDALAAAYQDLAARLGPPVLVCQTAPPGTEILLGLARDPALGPLVVAGAGGLLAELLADRVVALPPVGRREALAMLRRLRVFPLLTGARGTPPADLDAIACAITGLSAIAAELGGALAALDINPLVCGPAGAAAVDALAIPAGPASAPGTAFP